MDIISLLFYVETACCVVRADELTAKYEELSRLRQELGDQLDTARRDEQTARANVKATEHANCMRFFTIAYISVFSQYYSQ